MLDDIIVISAYIIWAAVLILGFKAFLNFIV